MSRRTCLIVLFTIAKLAITALLSTSRHTEVPFFWLEIAYSLQIMRWKTAPNKMGVSELQLLLTAS